MPIFIGIICCAFFLILRYLEKEKWIKLNEISDAHIKELMRESEIYAKCSNKVHFYVARECNGTLSLWLGKPFRGRFKWCAALNTSITFLHGSRNRS